MSTAVELLRQGRTNEFWTKYCGFLDLSMDEFMAIQERLLIEQINLLSKSQIGRKFLGEKPPTTVEEFRRRAPITVYDDYHPYLDERREDVLPEAPYMWAHTSGRSGALKWVPYTKQAYGYSDQA